jgi:DNA-binding Lrp family transcriptional regulator
LVSVEERQPGEEAKTMKDILKILENDARISSGRLATMTGKPVAEVNKFIEQAEKDRIILKYKTVINWEKAGDEQVWAVIEVRVAPQKDVGFDAIAERIQRFPQARSVYLISGTYDLYVLAVGKTNHEIADFVSQQLSHIEGVQETVTQFVLKRYKEDGELMQFGESARRQSVIL